MFLMFVFMFLCILRLPLASALRNELIWVLDSFSAWLNRA